MVKVDHGERIPRKRLARLLALHEVEAQEWMFLLEGRVGGMSFGESYFAVHLGFRHAFRQYLKTSTVVPLPRIASGEALLRIGVRGDTLFFLTESGEAWTQDGIADRYPSLFAASFDEMAAKLEWPIETRG